MANYNKVILAGNLTRDPQLSYLPSNTPVAEFGLAINRKWKDQQGNMRDDTCFVDVEAFGRQAETINQYLSKGRPVLVEGRLRFRSWEAKDGSKRNKLSVVLESFQFLGPAPQGQGGGRQPARAAPGGGEYGGGDEADTMPPQDYDPAPPMAEPGGDRVPF